jgi:hypothetical protein
VAVVVAFAAAFGCYEFGSHVEHEARVAEVNDLKRKDAEALATANKERADAEQAARDVEAKRVADMAALDANYQKELSDAKADADATIAGLRAGTVRLRDRFHCAAHPSAVPSTAKASTSPSGADDATGLQPADAGFLVRLVKDADAKVSALQRVLRNEREGQ